MKGKSIIIFCVLLLVMVNCGEEGNPFDKFLSKAINSFSPETDKKAEIVNLVTSAEEGKVESPDIESQDSTQTDSLKAMEEALLWEKIYYSDRGKPDPFRPLLEEREETAKEVNVDLASLIGIIWGKNGYLALLKEGNLGYVLKEGDKVVDGRVISITEESITFLITRFGEQNKVTLRLKKKEER